MNWKSEVIDQKHRVFIIDQGIVDGHSTASVMQYIGRLNNSDHIVKILVHSDFSRNGDSYLREGISNGTVNRLMSVDNLWFPVRGLDIEDN